MDVLKRKRVSSVEPILRKSRKLGDSDDEGDEGLSVSDFPAKITPMDLQADQSDAEDANEHETGQSSAALEQQQQPADESSSAHQSEAEQSVQGEAGDQDEEEVGEPDEEMDEDEDEDEDEEEEEEGENLQDGDNDDDEEGDIEDDEEKLAKFYEEGFLVADDADEESDGDYGDDVYRMDLDTKTPSMTALRQETNRLVGKAGIKMPQGREVKKQCTLDLAARIRAQIEAAQSKKAAAAAPAPAPEPVKKKASIAKKKQAVKAKSTHDDDGGDDDDDELEIVDAPGGTVSLFSSMTAVVARGPDASNSTAPTTQTLALSRETTMIVTTGANPEDEEPVLTRNIRTFSRKQSTIVVETTKRSVFVADEAAADKENKEEPKDGENAEAGDEEKEQGEDDEDEEDEDEDEDEDEEDEDEDDDEEGEDEDGEEGEDEEEGEEEGDDVHPYRRGFRLDEDENANLGGAGAGADPLVPAAQEDSDDESEEQRRRNDEEEKREQARLRHLYEKRQMIEREQSNSGFGTLVDDESQHLLPTLMRGNSFQASVATEKTAAKLSPSKPVTHRLRTTGSFLDKSGETKRTAAGGLKLAKSTHSFVFSSIDTSDNNSNSVSPFTNVDASPGSARSNQSFSSLSRHNTEPSPVMPGSVKLGRRDTMISPAFSGGGSNNNFNNIASNNNASKKGLPPKSDKLFKLLNENKFKRGSETSQHH